MDAIRLRDPGEIVACVPMLLGFHPAESLVLLLCGQRGEVRSLLRADLPGEGAAPGELAQVSGRMSDMPWLSGAVIVVYGAREESLLGAAEVLVALRDRVPVDGVWHVNADGWVSDLLESGVAPVRLQVSGAVEALAAVLALDGRAVLAGREQVGAPLAAGPCRVQAAVGVQRPQLMAALGWVGPLPADQVAVLLGALGEPVLRDDLIGEAVRDRQAFAHLLAVTSQAPEDLRGEALASVAMVAYLRGDGALANDATTGCLLCEPEHRLAQMVAMSIGLGLDPAPLREQILAAR